MTLTKQSFQWANAMVINRSTPRLPVDNRLVAFNNGLPDYLRHLDSHLLNRDERLCAFTAIRTTSAGEFELLAHGHQEEIIDLLAQCATDTRNIWVFDRNVFGLWSAEDFFTKYGD